MDLIIQYLIEKGGIFGVLFAIALSWIVFRERQLLTNPDKKDDSSAPGPAQPDGITNIINSTSDIKLEIHNLIAEINSIKSISSVIKSSVDNVEASVSTIKNNSNNLKSLTSEIKNNVLEINVETKKLSKDLSKLDSIIDNVQTLENKELSNLDQIDSKVAALSNRFSETERNIHDLWEWHSVRDSDGVPIWYVKRSLEDSINKLKVSIESLDKSCIESNKSIYADIDERLQKVNDERVSELKKLLEVYNKTVTDLVVALEKIKFLLNSREDGE